MRKQGNSRRENGSRPVIGSLRSWLFAFLAVIGLGFILNWLRWVWLDEPGGAMVSAGIALLSFSPLVVRALVLWRRNHARRICERD